jgi:outer membrane lipoprotein-sorting protein
MLLWVPLAQALDGNAVLARVDAASTASRDAHLVMDVVVTDRTGVSSTRTLEIWQKGADRRLVRFTAPARLAGTSLLVPDGQTLYLYLPAYGRPRRVVGQQQGDAFMGTDFSLEDLARLRWSEEWTATVEADEGDRLRLSLLPRDAAQHRDARLRVWVREADDLVARVEHLDTAGTVTRRLGFEDFRVDDGRTIAHRLTVEDVAAGKKTVATVRSADFDSGLDDARFALSALSSP